MKRPWQVWLVFVVCVTGAAAAMVWLSQQALDADRLRRVAEADAELEQRVSLALWRMDTELAPIIAEEVIRPPSAYRAANLIPPPYVLLHFEVGAGVLCRSPQVPIPPADATAVDSRTPDEQAQAARLAELASAIQMPLLLYKCPATPLPSIETVGSNFNAQNRAQTTEELNRVEKEIQFFQSNGVNAPPVQSPSPQQIAAQPNAKPTLYKGKAPQTTKEADFEQRALRYQSAAQQNLFKQQQLRSVTPNAESAVQMPADEDLFGAAQSTLDIAPEQVGVSRPMWLGDRLLLARRVDWNGETVVQGCWLDWPQIKKRLLAEAADLLPEAQLMPVPDDASTDPGRMLAGLPVRLVVGETAVASAVGPTLQWALWMGWGAVVLATAAAAALLHGVITLSERRAAFVSSVTHELRTPLTTFRMYAEMLARGMVPDAAQRQEYFTTLQREAERLSLLVENVLSYARLERGRKPQALEQITLPALLDRVGPRLAQRAAQADMQCDVRVDSNAGSDEFTTDLNVVEQILFNLVDNAAKYAREATDRRIHVDADRTGRWARISVRDHGPGIEPRRLARGTQAFGKSAQESAETAPGVGLGLALCKRLARQLGGRLDIAATPGGGATVRLMLPAV